MIVMTLRQIGVTLAEPLFAGLDLTLSRGDRLGLIAANGRGKSTLLRVMAGLDAPTHGDVIPARGLIPALVSQDVPEPLLALSLYDAVLEALPPELAESEAWRVDVVLADLEVPGELWAQPLGALSGGWQRVALLARGWVVEPDVLLLDEPTNHLDLARIGVLTRWLGTVARGVTVVVASHDRAFLDAVTTRSLFLRPAGSSVFALPYTPARAALDQADAAAARQYDTDRAKADQLRRQAAKLKNVGINSGSDLLLTKTKQLTARAEAIEDAARPAHQERSAGDIRLTNAGTHARALVALEPGEVQARDGRRLYRAEALWINRGDRVVVLGANGTGKTQLLRRVSAALDGDVPGVRLAGSVRAGVSGQGLEQLDRFATPFDAVTLSSDVGDRSARALLAGAGMDPARQDSPVARLSGGQRARLAMLLLRLATPNFYVLDEPTNHLDIDGQHALEREICAHGATALLVSHDRAFVRAVGSRFWQIDRGRLTEVDSPEPFFDSQMQEP